MMQSKGGKPGMIIIIIIIIYYFSLSLSLSLSLFQVLLITKRHRQSTLIGAP
jgi:hypothetical protein